MSAEKFVTVKYGSVKNSQAFAGAMGKLMTLPLDTKTAYNLKRIKDGVTSKIDVIRKEFRAEIIEKYGMRDEKGNLQTNEGNPDSFVPNSETFEAFLAADQAFAAKTFTLEGRLQIPGYTFGATQFTANEVEALDGVVDWSLIENNSFPTAAAALGANVVEMGNARDTMAAVGAP